MNLFRSWNFFFLFLLSFHLVSAMDLEPETSTRTHGRKGQRELTKDEINNIFHTHENKINKINRLIHKGFKVKLLFKTIEMGEGTPDIYKLKVTIQNKWHRPPHSLNLFSYTSTTYSIMGDYLTALYFIRYYEDRESVILRNFQHIKWGSEQL